MSQDTASAPGEERLPIRLVCATREDRDGFFTRTATGRTFALLKQAGQDVQLHLAERNSTGLPAVYNRAIDAARTDPAILLFVHDDLMFSDFFWADHLRRALEVFDVIGVAGNTRRVASQPNWASIDLSFTRDRDHLSGAIAHGSEFPPATMSYYGPSRREVKLLDGCLLAARSPTLLAHGAKFDERFAFHFYDMDFCRTVEQAGLRMGTWPIALVHQSGGNFDGKDWKFSYCDYLEKWGS